MYMYKYNPIGQICMCVDSTQCICKLLSVRLKTQIVLSKTCVLYILYINAHITDKSFPLTIFVVLALWCAGWACNKNEHILKCYILIIIWKVLSNNLYQVSTSKTLNLTLITANCGWKLSYKNFKKVLILYNEELWL